MSSSGMTIEPLYVVDTSALVWYLTLDRRLSGRANDVFQAARHGDTRLAVSVISLAELYYANKKWSFFPDFRSVYAMLKKRPEYRFFPLTVSHILDFDRDGAVPEMHDRIIAGLARRLSAPLRTGHKLMF